MGFIEKIKGLFDKKNVEYDMDYDAEWNSSEDEECMQRDHIDIHDKRQRENYVKACLEQMSEASRELEVLGGEYDLVTSYLTDMEEIEALRDETKDKLKSFATKIIEIENSQNRLNEKRKYISNDDFARMERIEQYMPEGYDRLKKAEEYQVLVKRDLGRLEGERHAYHFRKNELQTLQNNMKGITMISISSMLFLFLLLVIIGYAWKLDVGIGYAIAILIAASVLTLVYVKFHDSQRELQRVEKAINKLVLLQNTVKIRYVNNTNLLEYLYVKFNVNSSDELKKLWDKYLQEKKHREMELQMQEDMDINQQSLISLLRRCKVHDPNIWIYQAEALIDNREMVEIRHDLIIRRQKLRKQMEYNAKIAQEAQNEVKDIVERYPEYAKKILNMVDDYEKSLA